MSSAAKADGTSSSMSTRSRSRQQEPEEKSEVVTQNEGSLKEEIVDNTAPNKRARLEDDNYGKNQAINPSKDTLSALVTKSGLPFAPSPTPLPAAALASASASALPAAPMPPVPPPMPAVSQPKRGRKASGTRRRTVNHKHMKILSPAQRQTLKDIPGQEILKDMAFYMQHILGNSRENIKNVMNKVMMLVNGYGVRHQTSTFPGNVFKQGIQITLDHDFAAMDIEANDWVHAHGGDVSHGWLIKLPLRKMWVYQVARFERGGPFLDPSAMPDPALSHYYANAAFNPNGLPRVPGSRKPRRSPKQKIQDLLKNDYMNQAQRDLLNIPTSTSTNAAASSNVENTTTAATTSPDQLDTLPSDYNKQYYEVSNTAEV